MPSTWRVPAELRAVAARLAGAGHRAWLVGGSLRDLLQGKTPSDWDLATDALPAEVLRLFPGARPTGARFGTVTIEAGRIRVEATTLRGEGTYSDFRHPDAVTFARSIDEDLSRRDFTINAMAYPLTGGDGEYPPGEATSGRPGDAGRPPAGLLDPYGGIEDLQSGRIRAVGHPPARFYEDPLRMLRAPRLAAQLGFVVEPQTAGAIRRAAPLLGYIPKERVRQELEKVLPGPGFFRLVQEMDALALLPFVFPAVSATKGQPQGAHHALDVFAHTLAAVRYSAEVADSLGTSGQLAVLYHDVGKPATLSRVGDVVHFFGHEQVSAQLAEQDLRTLTFAGDVVEEVVWLIEHHMLDPRTGPKGMRRLRARAGTRERFLKLLVLRVCDGRAHRPGAASPGGGGVWPAGTSVRAVVSELPGLLEVLDEPEEHFRLALDGHAIMQYARIGPGPEVGRLKEALLEWALEDPATRNTPEALRQHLDALSGGDRGPEPAPPAGA